MWNDILMKLAKVLNNKSRAHGVAQCFNTSLVQILVRLKMPLFKNKANGQIRMIWIKSCAKQQIQINDHSEKRTSSQISIEQHSNFRWLYANAKAWKQSLPWFWIGDNQSLHSKESHIKSNVWKPCRDLHWLDELWFWLKEFFSNLSFDQPSITRFWRAVLNFKFSAFTFLRLMSSSVLWACHCKSGDMHLHIAAFNIIFSSSCASGDLVLAMFWT